MTGHPDATSHPIFHPSHELLSTKPREVRSRRRLRSTLPPPASTLKVDPPELSPPRHRVLGDRARQVVIEIPQAQPTTARVGGVRRRDRRGPTEQVVHVATAARRTSRGPIRAVIRVAARHDPGPGTGAARGVRPGRPRGPPPVGIKRISGDPAHRDSRVIPGDRGGPVPDTEQATVHVITVITRVRDRTPPQPPPCGKRRTRARRGHHQRRRHVQRCEPRWNSPDDPHSPAAPPAHNSTSRSHQPRVSQRPPRFLTIPMPKRCVHEMLDLGPSATERAS